ncbi:MAG: hypothetical protein V4654_13320 [Bdellovibrionota bacterium]
MRFLIYVLLILVFYSVRSYANNSVSQICDWVSLSGKVGENKKVDWVLKNDEESTIIINGVCNPGAELIVIYFSRRSNFSGNWSSSETLQITFNNSLDPDIEHWHRTGSFNCSQIGNSIVTDVKRDYYTTPKQASPIIEIIEVISGNMNQKVLRILFQEKIFQAKHERDESYVFRDYCYFGIPENIIRSSDYKEKWKLVVTLNGRDTTKSKYITNKKLIP